MTAHPPPLPSVPKRRPAANLAIPYAISTALGALPVFLSTQFALFPLIVMTLYLGFGLRVAQNEGFALEFADSFYYLGFTLTVASLLASLDPFGLHPDVEIAPKTVLHYFGLGMFTTLYGVTGRTVLQMFYRTPDESVEATNRRIAAAAQDFLRRLEELAARADDTLGGTLRALDAHVHRRADEVGAALGEILSQLNRAAAEFKGFRIDRSAIDEALRDAGGSISSASRKATKSLELVGEASAQLAQLAQSARDSARDGAEAVGKAVAQLGTHVEGAAAAAETLSKQVGEIVQAPERLGRSMTAAGQAFESLAKRLSEQFVVTEAGATQVSVALNDLSKQLNALTLGKLREEVVGLERSVATLRQTFDVDGHRPDPRTLAELAGALEESLSGAKRLNAVLDEIVEAVRLKLDRIQ